jgi:O-methyltransferase
MKGFFESPRMRAALRRVLPRSTVEKLKNLRQTLQVLQRVYEEEGTTRNRRYIAIEEIAGYLVGAEVPGDYLEFGVYQGTTFSYAAREMAIHFPQMQFHAFDSFEGLPEPKGIDVEEGFASNFYQGQFACDKDAFLKRLRKDGCPMKRIHAVKGWFDQTCAPENAAKLGIDQVAAAWIDGDLYESCVPVLNFLTSRVSVGSVIAFDDWRCYRNLPDYGEQRACREWLEANPQIQLRELFSFGWHGIAFTVSAC